MINILDRNQITSILSPNSVGCELGVFEGEFSQVLWDSGKFSTLYLVDLFEGRACNFQKTYSDCSILESVVKDRFVANNAVTILKQDSVSFLESMPDNFFDFIYIDTTHEYSHTVLELEKAHRCIKHNGFICGHDYTEIYFPGVVRAVQEFCLRFNYTISQTLAVEDYPSFMINISK